MEADMKLKRIIAFALLLFVASTQLSGCFWRHHGGGYGHGGGRGGGYHYRR